MGNFLFGCCITANPSIDVNKKVPKTHKGAYYLLKEKKILEEFEAVLNEEWYYVAEEFHLSNHIGISLRKIPEMHAAQQLSAHVETTQSLELLFFDINGSNDCQSFYTCSAPNSLEKVEIPDFFQRECEERRIELIKKGML